MANDKFHELYPDYELIPEKKKPLLVRIGIPALVIGGFVGAIIVSVMTLEQLGKVEIPIPSIAGVNQHSVITALNMAHQQVEAGQLSEAAANFRKYFDWGGTDPAAMVTYGKVLRVLGREKESREWQSRAARVKSVEAGRVK